MTDKSFRESPEYKRLLKDREHKLEDIRRTNLLLREQQAELRGIDNNIMKFEGHCPQCDNAHWPHCRS